MWIKEPPIELGKSMHETVNFLYNVDNIYIMDNHLAAGWSWLQRVNVDKSHYYLHIDRHYDLLGFKNTIRTQVIDKAINLHELSFQEYLDLKQPGNNGDLFQMFRWDNYILNMSYAYPDLFHETYFATHNDGNREEDFITKDVDFLELLSEIDFWIMERSDHDWIINLDLDYFYGYVNDRKIQIIDDEYIEQLTIKIEKIIEKVKVFTICLSPECCGGWQNSIEKAELVCKVLNLDFIEQLNKITTY